MFYLIRIKMISVLPIFHPTFLILVQAIFLYGSISANPSLYSNRSEYLPSSNLRRSKRFLWEHMPPKLSVNVIYITGEVVNIHWSVVNPKLANEYLPVIAPFGYLHDNVMKEVGEFVLYHDLSKCSAAVYLTKYNVMYGVIGLNYYIDALPFAFDVRGKYQSDVIGHPHILPRTESFPHLLPNMVFPPPSDAEAWWDFFQPTPTVQNQPSCASLPSEDSDEEDESSDEDIETVTESHAGMAFYKYHYLEILVLVTTDVAHLFKIHYGDDHYVEWIVIYHIIYFNAVDMMFRKLRTKYGDIRINIAKIVIEDELDPFNFMRNEELQFNNIIDEIPQYLQHHHDHFIPDSFDHVFLHTSRTIMDDVMPVNGMSKYGHDLYEARKHHRYYDVVPITVVKYEHGYAKYAVTIQELARTLTLKLDSKNEGLTLVGQCHSLMQREGPKCNKCLKWTATSRRQLRTFLKNNRNRCFLLNEPRSLRKPGASKFISATRQCQCFGYLTNSVHANDYAKRFVGTEKCSQPLECNRRHGEGLIMEFTVRPFDGTPATVLKVCWNGVATNAPKWSRPKHYN